MLANPLVFTWKKLGKGKINSVVIKFSGPQLEKGYLNCQVPLFISYDLASQLNFIILQIKPWQVWGLN